MNNRDILTFSVLTFITSVFWIFFDAYHVYTTSNVPENLVQAVTPLNSKIDTDVVSILKKREEIRTSLSQPIPAPPATISAQITPTPNP